MKRYAWFTIGCLAVMAFTSAGSAQVSNLKAVHREGQTFLTWQEVDPPLTEAVVSFPDFRETQNTLRRADAPVRYSIYRSDQPIESLEGLTPVGETGPLSAWNVRGIESSRPNENHNVPRYVIAEGQPSLAPGTGLYVHNPSGEGALRAYYAVTIVTGGTENTELGTGNRLASPVEESEGQGVPVLQSVREVERFVYVSGPTLRHYVRWEAPPHANRENKPNNILVAIPKQPAEPAPVGLHLHCWGANPWGGYGWWFNAEKGAILIAPDQEPYDWWTGYHERHGQGRRSLAAWEEGVVRPYTQTRLIALLDWAATQWDIDPSRVFTGGSSMGGSGAPMLAIRHPERIAWAIGWVGVHVPHMSPTFKSSYAGVYGDPEWGIEFEDGTPVWDYFNNAWYLRRYPERETPFITWSNGKNDGGIGWPQAVKFLRAMQETRRPHLFVWGQGGHGQRAIMPKTHNQRVMPIDIRIEQSLPAFTNCSLDGNPGNGDPSDGDDAGGVNLYLFWETEDIVDEPQRWEMTVGLIEKAPEDACTVDLTPRRLQTLEVEAGDRFNWANTDGDRELQSGFVTADRHGLITIEGLKVLKGNNRVRIWK